MSFHRRNRSYSPEPDKRRSRTDLDERDLPQRREKQNQNDGPRRDVRSRKRRSMSPRFADDEERPREKPRYRERSPDLSRPKRRRDSRSMSPLPLTRSRKPLPSQNRAFEQDQGTESTIVEKQKPNFALSGRLAAASNTVQTAGQTIVLKYHEPPEARKPPSRDTWRMYIFKDDEIVDTIHLFEQSCWLFGREAAVTDIPIDHLSCSKQHAVIQFRHIEKRNEFGDKIGKVKPYVLDLESSNGTFVNKERVPEAKYVELKDKDVLKFGRSRREYVIQLPAR